MTDNASPKRKITRPVRYPAAIPRVMTTDAQRAELDALAESTGATLGEVVRALIADGIRLSEYEAGRRRTLNG